MIKTILEVDGMMCGMCEAHVTEVVRRELDVKKVKASHSKKRVEVVSEQTYTEAAFKKVIAKTGYDYVRIISQEPYKPGLFS